MLQKVWVCDSRKHILCVDSYNDGVLKGKFYDSFRQEYPFASLSQFLLKMEQLLDDLPAPQAYTQLRRYHSTQEMPDTTGPPGGRGAIATFELRVIFRQHTSWQGVLLWREKRLEHSFRSVLELVALMDSALRSLEGSVVA